MIKRNSLSNTVPDAFFDYLKSNMEKYPIGSNEREIILLLFSIGYRKTARPEALFQNWNIYIYSESYSPIEAINLCENFIHESLGYNMNFSEAIDVFKVAFPSTTP